MKTLAVAVLCAVAALCIGALPGTAQAAGWLVLSNTGFVSGDPTLTLTMPFVGQPSLTVQASAAGDLKWIVVGVPLTFPQAVGNTIDAVAICYKTSNSASFISQTRLVEYLGPSVGFVKHDDPTDHDSTTDECYFSSVADYTPGGAVNLWLRLNFANSTHVISIGTVGVHFK